MKKNDRLVRSAFLAAALAVVVGIVVLISNFRMESEEEAIFVGAVFVGASDDNGWNQSHFEGISLACEENGCRMFSELNVPEEEMALREAVAKLVDEGCACIYLTSYGYGAYLNEIAELYPKVAFYCISGENKAANCMTYFARMYQVRYLSGIVAGAATESDVLGYVTSMPIPETIRSVNAYALGAQTANPAAKVLVAYTGSWDDQNAEEQAVRSLREAGADVITYHEDRPYAIDLADELGLYTTGYDFVAGSYSDRFLTAAVVNWDMMYSRLLRDYLSGRANFSKNYWLGLSDGAVSLYPYSDLVTEETRALVASEAERIKTPRDVFSGEIFDNTGKLQCGADERISDDELFNHMDWYAKGVEIYE